MPPARRSVPCPFPGCFETADTASDDALLHGGSFIWWCGAGHHGPHLLL